MKIRIVITTVLSVLLLFAVVAAGVNLVLTVTEIDVQFSLLEGSAAGMAEAEELKEKLDAYKGKSTAFLSLDSIAGEVDAYPCLRLEHAEKIYPSTLSVRVAERKQTFAVETEGGYAIFDETGEYLETGENVNRAGGNNIELIGFSDLTYARGERLRGAYTDALFEVFGVLTETLGEPRANVLSITLSTNEVNMFLVLKMREGICIEIEDPATRAREKAQAAIGGEGGYLSSPDERKVRGTITAYVLDGDGSVAVNYDDGYIKRENG